MSLRKEDKIGLIAVFSVGFLSLAATIVRWVFIEQELRSLPYTIEQADSITLWTMVEVVAGIIAFSMPSIRAVWMRTRKRERQPHPGYVFEQPKRSPMKLQEQRSRPGGGITPVEEEEQISLVSRACTVVR